MTKTDEKRVARIREEIIEAKKVAGIEPPRLIPRGDAFRSASSGRPPGALALELARPQLARDADDDVLPAFAGVDDTAIAPLLRKAMGEDVDLVLSRAERAMAQLKGEGGRRIAGAIADQLNLVAGLNSNNDRAHAILAKLEKIRFEGIEFKDQDDMPGGSQKTP